MVKLPCGRSAAGDLKRDFVSQTQTGHSAKRRQANHRLEDEASARSARTRQRVRGSRGRPRTGGIQDVQHGVG